MSGASNSNEWNEIALMVLWCFVCALARKIEWRAMLIWTVHRFRLFCSIAAAGCVQEFPLLPFIYHFLENNQIYCIEIQYIRLVAAIEDNMMCYLQFKIACCMIFLPFRLLLKWVASCDASIQFKWIKIMWTECFFSCVLQNTTYTLKKICQHSVICLDWRLRFECFRQFADNLNIWPITTT